MDVFTWSIPFLGEKLMDVLFVILNSVSKEELHASYQTPEEIRLAVSERTRKESIRNKVRAVSRMARVYNILREERERIIELKALIKSDRLPYGTLSLGSEGIRKAITNFEEARKCDLINEHLPPLISSSPLAHSSNVGLQVHEMTILTENSDPSSLATLSSGSPASSFHVMDSSVTQDSIFEDTIPPFLATSKAELDDRDYSDKNESELAARTSTTPSLPIDPSALVTKWNFWNICYRLCACWNSHSNSKKAKDDESLPAKILQ